MNPRSRRFCIRKILFSLIGTRRTVFPTAMHENTRDPLLLHPRLSASESLATSVAFDVTKRSGYRVAGRFARAIDSRLADDFESGDPLAWSAVGGGI